MRALQQLLVTNFIPIPHEGVKAIVIYRPLAYHLIIQSYTGTSQPNGNRQQQE